MGRSTTNYAALGCSTTARTLGATNLAVRTTPPVRVSSRTSTVVRELRTSTVRPARVASTTYSRDEPPPASTRTRRNLPLPYVFVMPNSNRIHAFYLQGHALL